MKKILSILAMLFVVILFSNQNPAPNGNDYTNYCSFNGYGDFEWVETWFNDDDGDCISSDYFVTWYTPDGSPVTGTGEEYGEMNFNDFNCCEDELANEDEDEDGGGSSGGSSGGGGDGCDGIHGLAWILCKANAL